MDIRWTLNGQRCKMARKKRGEVRRMPIDLDLDDPAQAALWERWQELSERGEASQWVRDTLIGSLPARVRGDKSLGQNGRAEPHYEAVEDT
jgi:hypothetical protein